MVSAGASQFSARGVSIAAAVLSALGRAIVQWFGVPRPSPERTVTVPFVSRTIDTVAYSRIDDVPDVSRVLSIIAVSRSESAAPFPDRTATVLSTSRVITLPKDSRGA